MGGEKLVVPFPRHRAGGSPPRGRGKVPEAGRPGADEGITPAWAGKSRPSPASEMPTKDHPRVGGEKGQGHQGDQRIPGSPPHRRGKAFSVLRRQFRFRITPAWAGKSRKSSGATSSSRDHPRVGGEKAAYLAGLTSGVGSPPRGRGKGDFHIVTHTKVGITPAWAGKKTGDSGQPEYVQGSPPRGRGKGKRQRCPGR